MTLKVFDMMARMLLLVFCLVAFSAQSAQTHQQTDVSTAAEFNMTAQLAHQLIGEQQADLLGDGSQLVSLYYFGQNNATSVVGLERVGDDYLPIRWLLVFKGQTLLGWYYPVDEFPARFEQGHLIFPKGASAEDIYLFPQPPKKITIEGIKIPFLTPATDSPSVSNQVITP